MTGTRVHDDERPLLVVDLDALGRRDAGENVVDRPWKLAAVHDELGAEFENVGSGLGGVLLVLLAALLHYVEEKHPALPGVDPIGPGIERGISQENGGYRRRLFRRYFLTGHG
jgi:hypothetical protein